MPSSSWGPLIDPVYTARYNIVSLYRQACREMLTRLRVQTHIDVVFAGYRHV